MTKPLRSLIYSLYHFNQEISKTPIVSRKGGKNFSSGSCAVSCLQDLGGEALRGDVQRDGRKDCARPPVMIGKKIRHEIGGGSMKKSFENDPGRQSFYKREIVEN